MQLNRAGQVYGILTAMSAAVGAALPSAEVIADDLERFIRGRFLIPAEDPVFSREVNLWEEGYVDSTGVVEVIAHLEGQLGLRIPEELLFDPDFVRIDGMARLLAELLLVEAAAEGSEA